MRKFLLLIFVLFISGCTINIDSATENKKENLEKEENEFSEEVISQGIASDVTNPLVIGDYGLASKYNVFLNEYKDVDVKLIKIYEDADSIIQRYNSDNPDNKIEKEKNYKFVVMRYDVVFFDFETESFGDKVRLDVDVVDVDGNNFVVNGIKQNIEIFILEEDLRVFNRQSGSVKIAFSIPEDIDSYLIKFGTYEHTIAYYKV